MPTSVEARGPLEIDHVPRSLPDLLEPFQQRLGVNVRRVVELHLVLGGAVFIAKRLVAGEGDPQAALQGP